MNLNNLTREGDSSKNDEANPISKKSEMSTIGRWTDKEHQKFLEAIKLYGNKWGKIVSFIGTRTVAQTRSHAQKHFAKLAKKKQSDPNIRESPSTDDKSVGLNQRRMSNLVTFKSSLPTIKRKKRKIIKNYEFLPNNEEVKEEMENYQTKISKPINEDIPYPSKNDYNVNIEFKTEEIYGENIKPLEFDTIPDPPTLKMNEEENVFIDLCGIY